MNVYVVRHLHFNGLLQNLYIYKNIYCLYTFIYKLYIINNIHNLYIPTRYSLKAYYEKQK